MINLCVQFIPVTINATLRSVLRFVMSRHRLMSRHNKSEHIFHSCFLTMLYYDIYYDIFLCPEANNRISSRKINILYSTDIKDSCNESSGTIEEGNFFIGWVNYRVFKKHAVSFNITWSRKQRTMKVLAFYPNIWASWSALVYRQWLQTVLETKVHI
jgi:hypothetical protein